RSKKMKTVAVIHDLAFHMFGKQYTFKDWALLHAFSAQVAREADTVIAVSQSTAHDIATYYGRTKDVHVVHHGVDLEKFHVPSEDEKQSSWQALTHQYPKLQKPYLLFVGQMQPRKNLVRLVKAFEMAKAEHQDLQLVISSGHGWKQAEILDAISASSVKNRIYMPGAVVDNLLPALYWHAQAFALVSMYEGFGMPILEALACGTPVVTSNVSSMPEVAAGKAMLVEPDSTESIAEGIKKALLQERGGGLTNGHSWDVCAQRTWQVIRRG
ncbi:MAG: glycosyltransferase family 4 protein, partial [Candidatus Andersenbacteria bacterium]|nr:glycosyltransferase family 4 protein [Candidatus Andersenbacteria bacterium]